MLILLLTALATLHPDSRDVFFLLAGDFSDDMRRMGAAGSDWSDWDAHLPASPTGSNLIESLPSSLNRTLSTQTSNKFEVAEGACAWYRAWPLDATK